MNKKSIALLAMSVLVSSALYAQTVLKGKVVDQDGKPIPGVSISLKDGTGTQTGPDGEFTISYKQAGALSISAIGYGRKEVNLSRQTSLEVVLSSDDRIMDEVIVTAMGITREKKSLGYAVQEVKSKELTDAGQLSLTGALSGKVAGVQVNQFGGAVGSSARISIRGNSSLNPDQQPLIVVDGVPMNNTAQRTGDNTYNGVDYGSGLNDINPEDIESIVVLKGGSAALYGMRAGKGVIMITTKSGKRAKEGVLLSYDGNFSIDQASTIPKYQNLYGQGNRGDEYHFGENGSGMSYQDYAAKNSFNYVDGAGGGVNDGFDESWGPRLDIGLTLPQFNSPVVNGVRQATPWISHPNNVKDFFQLGYSQNHNISLAANSERSSTRASLSFRNQKGTVPNTDQRKYTAQVNNMYKISDKWSYDIMSNYTRTQSDNLISQGYDASNPMNSFIWFGRQVDMKDLKNNWDQRDEQGNYTYYNWNSSYHMNPFYTMNNSLNTLNSNRIFGKSSLYYQPYEFLKFEGRVGMDYYHTEIFERNYHNYDHPDGSFRQIKRSNTEFNADFLATFNKQYGDFNVLTTLGANYNDSRYETNTLGADGLTVLGVYTITNKMGDAVTHMGHSNKRSNSVFGQASLGWKDQLYLDLTGRNDWSSTVDDPFFYPSASLSWIPTSSFANLKGDVLSFWKLRLNLAKIGNATDPYRNGNYYFAQTNAYSGLAQMYKSMTYAIPGLKPETIKTWEVGTELGFLNDRIHADFTYYYKTAFNQILPVATSNVVGFSSMVLNAGEIESKGVELQLRGDILKQENGLNWTTTINFAKDRNKILELYPALDLKTHQLGWTWGVANTATAGEAWGALRSTGYDRVEDGEFKGAIKVNESGLVMSKPNQIIGNTTPNYLASMRNDFRIKDFSFGFMLDFRKGGDIWSQTMNHGYVTGVAEITAADGIRERAIVAGKDVMSHERFVMSDGNGGWKTNTIETSAQDWYESGGIAESYIFDGSFLKLREAYLTYTIPAHIYGRLKGIKRANVSLIGSNLALLWVDKSNTMRLDPETGGVGSDSRGVGFEQATVPTSRSFGFKLGFSF
ncbi:SusC/RagA family TonB-linked outer membrane protein [Sphingobacterium psychroaquaticum]|uniref:TonB-linked outer membrane protein, SusC/RagA family n=1 Tax=Sphingobacterium psychroaquaticum TaxID=561061 RepID=A0A1X7L192_9SPHI|nr:SusC/RagA family TonB-linked outer membrane protein [Sphingobacterium psychroaquaticum]SMG47274.1 TonB-linked outer membrane protein, SusC/RagA family [Sphingobacterium psychroaquaticum]